jgi:hypothetical protein
MPSLGDPDLDLEDLLGAEALRHYNRFLGGQPGAKFYIAPDPEPAAWRAYQVRDELLEISRPADALVREGYGPDTCSTDTRLAIRPQWCWDVCGYYRRLGVPWTATRRELADAYLARGGPGKPRMTYALAQLLNPALRREYDTLPLGTLWIKDRYVVMAIRKAAAAKAARMSAAGHAATGETVLRAWGLRTAREAPGAAQGSAMDDQATLPMHTPWGTLWGWYEQGDCDQPRAWLPAWQAILVREFAARGLRVRFAVGLTCRDAILLILGGLSDGGRIILLGTRPPSLQLAARAVDEWQAADSTDSTHAAQRRPDHAAVPQGRRIR